MVTYSTYKKQMLSDLITPVGLFLKVRERYPQALLLESSDYSSREDSSSFICFDSLSHFIVQDGIVSVNGNKSPVENVVKQFENYTSRFISKSESTVADGVFGFTGFDAVAYFDGVKPKRPKASIPTLRYDFYRFAFVFNHFNNTLELIEHCPEGEDSQLDNIAALVKLQDVQTFSFSHGPQVESSLSDEAYEALVEKAKQHCQRGDVFQLVLSKNFSIDFSGDEFNVYRSLRSINPSPYLFYYDYGSYKIFGSSPEAQLKIDDGIAEIHPIAGTFKRTGNFEEDNALAEELKKDPKENAEHVMLVDLARNDLSKNTSNVHVASYKQIQLFSHVIHLVSVVKGKVKSGVSPYQIFADTFPAGTLSGAPKHRALHLINDYEPQGRSFYGGGIGMVHFNGNLNHAIIIRSFLSHGQKLHFQAGAGLVIDSVKEKERQEVYHKTKALRSAIEQAQTLNA